MSWLKPGPSKIFELTNSLSSLCHTLDLDGNVGLSVCNASNRVFCAGQISLLATDLRGGRSAMVVPTATRTLQSRSTSEIGSRNHHISRIHNALGMAVAK